MRWPGAGSDWGIVKISTHDDDKDDDDKTDDVPCRPTTAHRTNMKDMCCGRNGNEPDLGPPEAIPSSTNEALQKSSESILGWAAGCRLCRRRRMVYHDNTRSDLSKLGSFLTRGMGHPPPV